MRLALGKRTTLGIATAIALFISMGGLAYRSLTDIVTTKEWVAHTQEVVADIYSIRFGLANAQSLARGYVIGGHLVERAEFTRATEELEAAIRHGRQLTIDNPKQTSRFDHLINVAEEYLRLRAKLIDRRDSIGITAASRELVTDGGLGLYARAREILSEMEKEENQLHEIRVRSSQATVRRTTFVFFAGNAIALALALLMLFLLNRDYVRRELAEEERDRFFQVSPDLLGIAGFDGIFRRVNPAFEATLGYNLEELCQRPFLDFVHPDDRERTVQEAARGTDGQSTVKFENRYLCKNGDYKWLSWRSTPKDQLIYAIARDVTQLKKDEAELVTARQLALDAVRAKSHFLANISHEIRTPLNAVIGMADLLMDTSLTPEQRKYARILQTSGQSVVTIINDVLDFSKLEAGKFQLETTDFSPVEVIENQADLLSARAAEKGLSLMTFVDPSLPEALRGDPGRIGQIMLNLLSNAIKFSQHGAIIARVERLEETAAGVRARFSVGDEGIGLSAEAKRSLFQPFTQADGSTARKYGGTGLGLSISKRLVELMNGEMGVESETDRGSTFWFILTLPAARAKDPLAPHDFRGMRALVVDDDPASGEILQAYLRQWGVSAEWISSGDDALAALPDRTPYDVILIDRRMPRMDGYALAGHLKQDKRFAEIPLILITAFDTGAEGRIAIDAGFRAALTKPIRQSTLFDCLMSIVNPELAICAIEPAPTTVAKNGRTALVVEDNPVNQMLSRLLLEGLGFSVTIANNGREAVTAVASAQYSLIFMDCQMPEMDGFEATRIIRENEGAKKRTPIIALTANAQPEDRQRCLECGMDDYLPKPINKARLAEVLARWQTGPAAFDPNVLEAMRAYQMPGKADVVAEMAEVFLRSAGRQIIELETAIAAGDEKKFRSLAHQLKSSSATVGAMALSDICRRIEAGENLPRQAAEAFASVRAQLETKKAA